MKEKLIIIGTGGHGKVAADVALNMNKWESIEFLTEDQSVKTCLGLKVVGKTQDAHNYRKSADFFIAIGNNQVREKVYHQLIAQDLVITKLIHPTAIIGLEVNVGEGTIIMPGVIINTCSEIGKGCIINTKSSIDHDNKIEDFVHISPGVTCAGAVNIGKSAWIGAGSTVKNNITICCDVVVGAGAVVVKDIKEPGTYVGVPATKRVKQI